MKRLNEMDKIFILQNFENSSFGWMESHIGCSRSTIYYFIKRFNQRKTIQNVKSSGGPLKLSKLMIKRVNRLVKLKPSITRKEIIAQIGLTTSVRTLSKYLPNWA